MVKSLDGRILNDWAKARTLNGIPYYVNHSLSVTQWDHPEYIRVMEEMQPLNTVHYVAYRTACKLRRIQTKFKIHEASLQCLSAGFDSAGLKAAENADYITVPELERILLCVIRNAHQLNRPIDVCLCTDLILNFVLNVCDENRTGNVQVLSCKVVLIVLCGGRLQEKYRYLFSQLADHNNCCTRRRLAVLLRDLAKIPELLSECPAFGVPLVSAAVESCFTDIVGDVGVTEEYFLHWFLQEPQTLVWWSTLYRLAAAELVCHDVKCGVCKQKPIIGLRYQCLRCLSYDLCQDCFLHARTSRTHKLTHPIQEYCHESTAKDWRKALVKIIGHRITKRRLTKPRYLSIASHTPTHNLASLLQDTQATLAPSNGSASVEEISDKTEVGSVDGVTREVNEVALRCRTLCPSIEALDSIEDNLQKRAKLRASRETLKGDHDLSVFPSTPRHQINSVIMQLQEGQRQLSHGLESSHQPIAPQLLEKHTLQLQTQINKLKLILQNVSHLRASNGQRGSEGCLEGGPLPRMESTPIVGDRGLCLNFSPIGSQLFTMAETTAELDNKENHLTECPENRDYLSAVTNSSRERKSSSGSYCSIYAQKGRGQLPSFTEINFSDLTQMINPDKKEMGENEKEIEEKKENRRIEKEQFDDTQINEVRSELDNILQQLERIFPVGGEGVDYIPSAGVMEAAYEVGDILCDYVDSVPLNS